MKTTNHTSILPQIVLAFLCVNAIPTSGVAAPVTPRSVGMADNALPLAFGMEALTENPAALGVRKAGSWELQLFNASTAIGSNALGFGDYRLYNGATLSDADKASILGKIPTGGWRLGAQAEVSAAAVRIGPFGARLSGYAAGRGNLDREILELLLYGNQQDRLYTSKLNSGEALAAAELSLSGAARLWQRPTASLYGGLTVRLIRGLYYAQLHQTEGSLVAEFTGVSGSGHASATTAEGGNGIAVDWGALLTLSPRFTVGLVLDNAPGLVRWSTNAQTKQYDVTFDGITADNFEDSLWVDNESTTSIPSFGRSLPMRLRLGVGRTGAKLQTTAVATFGFSNRLTVSSTPEFGLGAEYSPVSFFPLRAGLTIGGLDGFSTGLGGGVFLGAFHLELGLRTAGGLWPTHGRGAELALAGALHF